MRATWATLSGPSVFRPRIRTWRWRSFLANFGVGRIPVVGDGSRTCIHEKRYLLVGWLWFLGILVPMIGVIQVGDQAMADRYAYIPFIGLFWMATWTYCRSGQEWHFSSRWLAVPACLVIVVAAALTPRQVTYWHDSETFWRYALRVTDRNFMAHSYLAARADEGGQA